MREKTLVKVIIDCINKCYLWKYNLVRWIYYKKRRLICKICGAENYDQILKPWQYKHELKTWYYIISRCKLNLKNPITYNEKIQWFKLYGVTPRITKLCDKIEVRTWVKEKIGEEYLIPLLGVWDSFEEIDFDGLPERFVLKCNHGAGYNEIIYNKSEINEEELKLKFDKWLSTNYAFTGGLELQYKDIHPRILAEQYMENGEKDLYDYKFWCFGGKCKFVMFLSERNTHLCMNNYDLDWNLLPFTYGGHENSKKDIERPAKLNEMIKIAEKLAEGFPHVRVDLYLDENEQIKFGEMTFTSFSGVMRWSKPEVEYELGALMNIRDYLV